MSGDSECEEDERVLTCKFSEIIHGLRVRIMNIFHVDGEESMHLLQIYVAWKCDIYKNNFKAFFQI